MLAENRKRKSQTYASLARWAVVTFEKGMVSALIGLILLGLDMGLSLNASDEHRQALGELEALIEIEHGWNRLGVGCRTPHRRHRGC